MPSKNIIPVILCGGSGTRLWPLSRRSFPKQFLSIANKEKISLLQKTIQRTKKINNIQSPILICNEEHRFIVAEQMREINVKPQAIILEPFGRNTAPAITIAALKSLENGNNANLLILSADHKIENEQKFRDYIHEGLNYSLEGRIVTFGILPTTPNTGYGYIKSKDKFINSKRNALEVESFSEKPDLEKAKQYLKDKRFTWNSGIFLFKANVILKEINKFSPEILNSCKDSMNQKLNDLDFQRLNSKSFYDCPNISIDVSVMENTKNAVVLPIEIGWSDIGSWESVWQSSIKDKQGNVCEGNVHRIDTEDCYLKSNNRLIAAIGIKNIILIETIDAILVADKNKSQEVNQLVNTLDLKKIPQASEHNKTYRPWGNYQSLVKDKRWQVKLINVKPGQKLSLQKHKYRSEHWVVVSGEAKIQIDNKVLTLSENQSTYIPLGIKHRLSNETKKDLIIIEIQSGSYVGEDDIIRFEDNYGRIS